MKSINDIKNNFNRDLKSIISDIDKEVLTSNNKLSDKISDSKNYMKILEEEKNQLPEPYLSMVNKRIKEKMKDIKYFGSTSCFDKLFYFIDRVKAIDIPEHIIRKNKNFGVSISNSIASMYLEIYAFLCEDIDEFNNEKNYTSYNMKGKYKNDILSLLEGKYYNEILSIATAEAENYVDSVMKQHGVRM